MCEIVQFSATFCLGFKKMWLKIILQFLLFQLYVAEAILPHVVPGVSPLVLLICVLHRLLRF